METSSQPSPGESKQSDAGKRRKSNIYTFHYRNKKYRVDSRGFLLFPSEWDEDFAVGKAPSVGIDDGLTEQHWNIIHFVRNSFKRINQCPLVYVACRKNHLGLGDLRRLFPTGYLRGVCKLAGVSNREAFLQHLYLEENSRQIDYWYDSRTYSVDLRGFLINPNEWDENFAIHKAYELKMPDYLTDRHFEIIHYLRRRFAQDHQVPTVFETCDDLHLSVGELESLFPSGYHRGAVKVAGLRVV